MQLKSHYLLGGNQPPCASQMYILSRGTLKIMLNLVMLSSVELVHYIFCQLSESGT